MPRAPKTDGDRLLEAMKKVVRYSGATADLAEGCTSADEAVALFGAFWDFAKLAGTMKETMGTRCIDLVPRSERFDGGLREVPGGGVLRFGGGSERKRYDQPKLVSTIAQRLLGKHNVAAVVTTEGEPTDAGPVIEAIVSTVASAAGATAASFSGWRSGVTKELGINLGDFCDKESAPVTVRIEGR